jgi:hypothetical protein
MAQKIEIKTLLENVVLVKGGKVVTDAPVSDNYGVHPVEGSALALMPGQEVLKVLQEAFPKCVFTWLSEPMKKGKAAAKDEDKAAAKDEDKAKDKK